MRCAGDADGGAWYIDDTELRFEDIVHFGINLRSDLAKRSDAELAQDLDRLCEYRRTRFGTAPRVGSIWGILRYGFEWPFGRGPIHARTAYKFWIGYYWIFRGPRGTLYLVECEIEDLRDEIERRAGARKARQGQPS
jgi:hypothetical protein